MKKTIILNEISIDRKIKRLSFEIYERNLNEKKLLLFGVKKNGFILANLLKNELVKICNIKIQIIKLTFETKNNKRLVLRENLEKYFNVPIIIIDDVCNSGKTLLHVVSNLAFDFSYNISTLVLVDRKHHNFPIMANYVGIEVSTTLKQFIKVELESQKVAYLI